MTDLDIIRAMLTRAGVKFTEHPWKDSVMIFIEVDENMIDGERFGYPYFTAAFYFKTDNSLLTIGAWE